MFCVGVQHCNMWACACVLCVVFLLGHVRVCCVLCCVCSCWAMCVCVVCVLVVAFIDVG